MSSFEVGDYPSDSYIRSNLAVNQEVSFAPPNVRGYTVHNCGTTINNIALPTKGCPKGKVSSQLQSWCSPAVAAYGFGMRKITQPHEYYSNIKKYLNLVKQNDSKRMVHETEMRGASYQNLKTIAAGDFTLEKFITQMREEVTDYLNVVFANTCDKIPMFYENNPLKETMTITDIKFETFGALENKNFLYHQVMVSTYNLARGVTNSFKVNCYQKYTGNNNNKNNPSTKVFIIEFDFVNSLDCVTGQESKCNVKPYNILDNDINVNSSNDPIPVGVDWLSINSLNE